jgi:hypothetical protein
MDTNENGNHYVAAGTDDLAIHRVWVPVRDE